MRTQSPRRDVLLRGRSDADLFLEEAHVPRHRCNPALVPGHLHEESRGVPRRGSCREALPVLVAQPLDSRKSHQRKWAGGRGRGRVALVWAQRRCGRARQRAVDHGDGRQGEARRKQLNEGSPRGGAEGKKREAGESSLFCPGPEGFDNLAGEAGREGACSEAFGGGNALPSEK